MTHYECCFADWCTLSLCILFRILWETWLSVKMGRSGNRSTLAGQSPARGSSGVRSYGIGE